ncbi:unnamed protein product [Meganyctiphanes norvegica]|uniref:Sulfotransferase domain-containing protein n=1 Tax=Meganyctiphanes norvegica TaxID=48144 RepID=A0AAV2R4X7_MEGNR
MFMLSGHVSKSLEDTREQRDFPGYTNGLMQLTPGKWVMPSDFMDIADTIFEIKYGLNDVVCMDYPGSGGTALQELVWTMRNNPDLDNPDADLYLNHRVPHLEADAFMHSKKLPSTRSEVLNTFNSRCPNGNVEEHDIYLQMALKAPGGRTFKTHLSPSLMSPNLLTDAKVVYIVRNPKDVCMAYYHISRLAKYISYDGSFGDFVSYFVNDQLMFGPYWEYIREMWNQKEHPGLHIIQYENLMSTPDWEIKRLNFFLGTNLTEEQMAKIVKYTSLKAMKQRAVLPLGYNPDEICEEYAKKEGGFYECGGVGDWMVKMNKSQGTQIDSWTKQNSKGLENLKFNYDKIIIRKDSCTVFDNEIRNGTS